ncbi:MAG: DUF2341 domain-containing protein, partial [Planctomycetota bacterium]
YHTLSRSENVSKNTMTVGSVRAISRDEDGIYSSGGNISGFSSRGPTEDGRIKPDVVAQGSNPSLYSPDGEDSSGYSQKQGTSMASPNAAGSSVLLMDYFRQRFSGQMMRAATVRALLINTAIDLGNPGPDYIYGWGAIDVLAAAKAIRSYAEDPQSRVLREEVLQEGETHQYSYHSDGSQAISVTLVWHEQGGSTTDASLVNNLHLRVLGPNGSTHYPFVMPYVVGTDGKDPFDSDLFGAHAITGVNNTDNVLQVAFSDSVAGSYTIEVYHAGSLAHEQDYSLAISGMTAEGLSQPQITAMDFEPHKSIDHQFHLTGEDFMLGANVEFRRPDRSPVQAYSAMVHPTSIAVRVDNRSMDPGYWTVVVVNPDGQEAVLETEYVIPAQEVLYATDFSDDTHGWDLEGDWAVHEPTFDPREAAVGTRVLSSHPDSNYPAETSGFAYSPEFDLSGYQDAQLHLRRWLGISGSSIGSAWQATIDIRIDGGSWERLWDSGVSSPNDNGWMPGYYHLGSAADGKGHVQLRFAVEYIDRDNEPHHTWFKTGWNMDDVQLIAQVAGNPLPPEITSTPTTQAAAGQAYSYALTASDPDTDLDQLQWHSHDLPSWLSLTDHGDGTATLSGTPDGSDQGIARIHVAVADEYHTTWQSFDLEVTSSLFFTQQPVFTGNAGEMSAEVAVNLDSGVTLTATSLPDWLSFSDHGNGTGTGTLQQVASTSDYGARDVVISATDGDVTTTLRVTVYRQMQDYLQVVYPHFGEHVVVLSRSDDLQAAAVQQLLDGLDAGWAYYASVTDRQPDAFFTYDGSPTIAEVPNGSTCGAGCGYLGASGIELTADTFATLYNGVANSNVFDQAVFYEMGRNFWFYGDPLNYHDSDDQWVVATGYAVFMRFMSMQAAGVIGGPFNGHSFADFKEEVRGLIDTYLADEDADWESTLRQGLGVSNSMGLGGTDLFASFLFRLTDMYGTDMVERIWQEAGALSTASDTQTAVDNLIRSASHAVEKNLVPLFISWRWPVSQGLYDELDFFYPMPDYTTFTITFPGYDWGETLADFPLLLRLSNDIPDFVYENMAYPDDGRDLRFYAEDGSELPFRMETWDRNGESAIWLRVPELDADTTITMRIGDPDNDTLPSYTTDETVWAGSPYLSVWNLNEAAGEDRLDVRGGRHAQPQGNNTVTRASGIVGGAAGFDGSDGRTRLHVGDTLHASLQFTTGLSIEGWLWINQGAGGQYRELVSQDNAYHRGRGYRVNLDTNRLRTAIGTESGTGGGNARETEDVNLEGGVPEEQWLHVVVVWHDGRIRTYINGVELADSAFDHVIDYLTEDNPPLVLGAGWHGDNSVQNRSLDGLLDEVRVSDQALSADWIAATHANIAQTTSFLTIEGVPETSIVIDQQPAAQQLWEGETITLGVVASGGEGELQYQWQKDGSDIADAQADTLTIEESVRADSGWYRVRISDDEGTKASQLAEVRIMRPRTIHIQRLGDFLWLINPAGASEADDGQGDTVEFTPIDASQEHQLTPEPGGPG